LTDVDDSLRKSRQRWLRDRPVSIPPYLRPIEEESDNEDQLDALSIDCRENSASCLTMTSSAGSRDVTRGSPCERLQNDVIADGQRALDEDGESPDDVTESRSGDRRCQPISELVANHVITTGQCAHDDKNRVTDNDVTRGKSPSRDPQRPSINAGDTGGNDVTVESHSKQQQQQQHWRLFYVIAASLTAFIACLTSMSPSGFICIVTVISLVVHHVVQS